jgi:hypothetical protein
MNRLFFSLFAVVFLMTYLFLATAAAAAETEGVSGFLVNFIVPLGAALLVGLVNWAVYAVARKYNLDIVLRNQDVIERAALKGISLAEEYAAQALKQKNIRLSGNDKLNMAIDQVLSAAPKLSREEASEWVNAVLARVKGVGATGEKVVQ